MYTQTMFPPTEDRFLKRHLLMIINLGEDLQYFSQTLLIIHKS